MALWHTTNFHNHAGTFGRLREAGTCNVFDQSHHALPDPKVEFFDSLEQEDGKGLGSGWNVRSGSFIAKNGRMLSQGIAQSGNLAVVNDFSAVDMTVSCNVNARDGSNGTGLAVRVQPDGSHYQLSLYTDGTASYLFLVRHLATNQETSIDDLNVVPSYISTLKVVVRGSGIQCYADDVLIETINDVVYASGGAGICDVAGNGGTFANFFVTTP